MKTVKGLAIGLLLLCLAAPVLAETAQLALGGGETRLELMAREGDALRYRLSLAGLAAERVATPAGAFTRLSIPGYYQSQEIGAPALPMLNRLIELPLGAEASIEILAVQEREIDLAGLGFGDPLYPTQPSLAKSADPASQPFRYDPAAYRAEPVARDLVAVVDCGQLRGARVGRLEVSPVTYYPEAKRLRVAESIEFRVNFTGGDPAAETRLKALTRSPFFTPVYERLDGTRGLHDSYPDRVRDLVTLVVVTPPEFEAQLADYVDWKTRRGFKVVVGVTGTPEVGTTKEQIKAWITGLYTNATPELPAPSFVVFVGDIAQMPTWTEGGDVTDRPYCAIEGGDLMPDIYYGRLSATNPTMLQAILDKTLEYDQFAMPDPDYLEEVVMIAGVDASHGTVWANGQINYGTTYYFNPAHNILSHTYLYPGSGSADAQIVQDVSNGVSYVNYTAHGSETSWSDPTFTQGNINGLQNYSEYCLAVGNCCLTSSYQVAECMAETWLRVAGKGAIGYIGGSNSTYWDEDYWWGVGSGAVVTNPTYETHGMGAYDGLFHDHGEAMTQWYVTNDALIFCGNLAVTEAGSSLTSYYWTIYNLMGDPSLSTWIGVPQTNPVSHASQLFTTSSSLTVSAAPGSYCGLSQGGVLVGAGTVGETGSLDLEIWSLLTPGAAELIVMAQNKVPHTAALNVIVPATIVFDPDAIDAQVPTLVTVGVYEADGATPKPGIEVWAEGVGYSTAAATTGADGTCQLLIDYPYGPSVDICGQDPLETWLLFRQPLTVNALPLTDIGLRVSTDIGLTGSFALNLPGTLEAFRLFGDLPAHELWAYVNDEPGTMTTAASLTLTPTALGAVRGVYAQLGYNLVVRSFPIIEAFGTLTGHVDAAGSPAVGAVVQGWDGGGELAFAATCNASGNYDVGEDILVADYTLTVDYFGFLPHSESYFVNYGANVHDIALVAAPSGVLTGTVTEVGSGQPLVATISIYRSDTGALYNEVSSAAGTGLYTSGPLPYFDWTVTVRCPGHIAQTRTETVDAPAVTADFALEETVGNILIINDGAKIAWNEPKLAADGSLLAAGYFSGDKSIATIQGDLEDLGYTVVVETMASNPSTWGNYDFLMTCSGRNTDTLANASFRTALQTFVQGGGKLLVEGGEVGYDWDYQNSTWAQAVLRVANWISDSSGSVTVYAPAHPVMSYPNAIVGPISVSYAGYGDQDALVATATATRIGAWTSYPSDASIIVQDLDSTPEDGDFVMFAWCYESMDATKRVQLLENAVIWLIGGGLTGVEETPASLPSTLVLRGNHPNPFNPKTDIRFALPAAAAVNLAVYDVTGRRLVTLVSGRLEAGDHSVAWLGTDANGVAQPSGVYFARLSAEGATQTRKMLLLK